MSDIIRRYFEYRGFDVNYIMNLTDVDDRIIKKSIDQKISPDEVASQYTIAFFDDIEKLGVKKATAYPRATDNIPEMIDIIKKLIATGKAYQLGNDVYFKIEEFREYGKLSGKNTDELIAGARVSVDEEKMNPLDFALWKSAKEGEPFWESPWGKGRPGWHIECSAMSMKYLGETIDIHCGGNDLIFPHHENEIAQSEGFTGKRFSNYWIHFGFLNINNEKMSKSLGNFFTAREILEKYNGNIIRVYFLQTHYSAPLHFSDDGLEAAKNGYERIQNTLSEIDRRLESKVQGSESIRLDDYENKFVEAMDEDFNTPKAISVLFDLIKQIITIYSAEKNFEYQNLEAIRKFFNQKMIDVFGISAKSEENNSQISSTVNKYILNINTFTEILGKTKSDITTNKFCDIIEYLIEERHNAKKTKNWSLADKIRNELKNIGIILEDKKDGTTIWKAK
jgi:cysteinyl-tRNA synthetase